jgi:ubiquinone/menaquinone biosynthesis C-methylase UbiE
MLPEPGGPLSEPQAEGPVSNLARDVDRDIGEMDWEKYAAHYDEMCALNPAYRENICLMMKLLESYSVYPINTVCDVGAGTGNYTLALMEKYSDAEFTHLDANAAMTRIAAAKLKNSQVGKVVFEQKSVENYNFPISKFDLVVCTNALYATEKPLETLAKIHGSIKAGGYFFVIDFAKIQNTSDWTLYLFRQALLRGRILRYLRALIVSREVIKQNRMTTKAQTSGRYWTHTETKFRRYLMDSGFLVLSSGECYRGYCNYALSRKAP